MIQDDDFRMIFDHLPGLYLIVRPDAPHFTIAAFSKAWATATRSGTSVIGKNLFDVFPDNDQSPGAASMARLRNSLQQVIDTKAPHKIPELRYDLRHPETDRFDERHWSIVNLPLLDEEGNLKYILNAVEDVTGQVRLLQKDKRAEEELQRLHREQSEILESIADGFLSTDRNWTVKYWNKQAEVIFNISRRDILGKCLWDFIRVESDGKMHACFHQALKEARPVHFEEYYKDQKIWLQVNAYPSPEGLTAFMVNITESRNAQEALRSRELRFRALIENVSDGLAMISADNTLREITAPGLKILGYAADALVGHQRTDLIHPDDLPLLWEVYQSVLDTPSSIGSFEYRFRVPDGSYIWLEASFHNLLHEPAIGAIVMSFRDCTRRREQEAQLQASEEKYRYLFHNSPATIVIWTLDDFCIHEVNQTAMDLYGYTRNEFLGMTVLDLLPVEEHERIISLALALKQESPVNQGVWVHKTKTGDIRFMNISFFKISFGGRTAVLSLGTNVTETILLQKKLDEERTRRQREITEAVLAAQEAERAELARELHDNINQILSTTRLYIEYSLTREDRRQELLQSSRDYISKAIREIRQLSRRLMPPLLGEISLQQSLEELFRNLQFLSGFKFSFEFMLPDESRLDSSLKMAVFRIVQEGLNNIFKHAEATEAGVRIEQKESRLVLVVRDNGIGFDPRNSSRGLGFQSIVSRASLLGGQVELDSHPGKGTELQVSFPL